MIDDALVHANAAFVAAGQTASETLLQLRTVAAFGLEERAVERFAVELRLPLAQVRPPASPASRRPVKVVDGPDHACGANLQPLACGIATRGPMALISCSATSARTSAALACRALPSAVAVADLGGPEHAGSVWGAEHTGSVIWER